MATGNIMANEERELVLTHVFDAPRELVFKLWTDPKQVAQWWGPPGFTNPAEPFLFTCAAPTASSIP